MPYHPLFVFFVLAAVLCALATHPPPRWGSMRVKHAWDTVPENWECLGHPAAGATIDLNIALKSQREDALVDALLEVSDPAHPKYGAHLSSQQVAELVAPHPETLELVNSWLEQHGVPPSAISTTHGGSWLTVSGVRVSQANDLLGASFQLYRHAATNSTILRTISYGLPAELHTHVQAVAPTTYFGPPRQISLERTRGGSAVLSSRKGPELVVPSYLRWLYKTMGYVPVAAGKNRLGIGGFLGNYPSPDDLRIFMNEFRTDGADASFSVVKVNGGGYDPSNPGSEASQNVQYAAAITYPTPLVFYSTRGTKGEDDMFLNWLNFVLMQESIPQTISVSYGGSEDHISPDLARSLCSLFAQLGARGVSFIISSGNEGVGNGDCTNQHGSYRFLPPFPASCPWLTSVGGTTDDSPEVAASVSGGGFSDYFLRPRYQDNAISTFLRSLGRQYNDFYNPEGRGIPDISAQALSFVFAKNGQAYSMVGTSCAVPVVAGIVSLLNDLLISKGKPPLGFLNPWLYGGGLAGLNDITSGSNPGCGTDGFSAIAGWDPVTGLGTPDFDRLEEILDD